MGEPGLVMTARALGAPIRAAADEIEHEAVSSVLSCRTAA
jgi:hypothetical protein